MTHQLNTVDIELRRSASYGTKRTRLHADKKTQEVDCSSSERSSATRTCSAMHPYTYTLDTCSQGREGLFFQSIRPQVAGIPSSHAMDVEHPAELNRDDVTEKERPDTLNVRSEYVGLDIGQGAYRV